MGRLHPGRVCKYVHINVQINTHIIPSCVHLFITATGKGILFFHFYFRQREALKKAKKESVDQKKVQIYKYGQITEDSTSLLHILEFRDRKYLKMRGLVCMRSSKY